MASRSNGWSTTLVIAPVRSKVRSTSLTFLSRSMRSSVEQRVPYSGARMNGAESVRSHSGATPV